MVLDNEVQGGGISLVVWKYDEETVYGDSENSTQYPSSVD